MALAQHQPPSPVAARIPRSVCPRRAVTPLTVPAAEVLRIVSDSRTPVFGTALAGGRLRYGYWRPNGPAAGTGGYYVALPTAVCEELLSTGHITLGAPVSDPGKTTYRVSPARDVKRTEGAGHAGRWAA
ncbi:hypothetical protein RKD23_007419 [Streptomyces sp. SAI-170]|uniref:hypothetical protein n=1 Tax=Streptomyces sp. SAI-170 TaxID=3377729 RepID=UPI003C7DCB29